MLLMSVSAFNNFYGDDPYNLCLRRDECLANCEADMFPNLICGNDLDFEITYDDNEYDSFFLYPETDSSEFRDCRDYVADNEDVVDTNDGARQWRVHTCFRACREPDMEENSAAYYETDTRPICTAINEEGEYSWDLICVNSDDDCEVFQPPDEICLGDVCISFAAI